MFCIENVTNANVLAEITGNQRSTMILKKEKSDFARLADQGTISILTSKK